MIDRTSKTPQEKKALSYGKDCRNMYFGNDKAARKAIPARKAAESRRVRRKASQALENVASADEATIDLVESSLLHDTDRVGGWTKGSDAPLGEYIEYKNMRRAQMGLAPKRKPPSATR